MANLYLADLLDAPELAMGLPFPEAAAMLARVGALEALLRARLGLGADTSEPESSPNENRWLAPEEAATMANVPRRVVYGWSRRADWRGFTRRLSRKVLRIEERGFRRWLDRQIPK